MNQVLGDQPQPAARRRARAVKRPKPPAAPIEATPYGRKLFAQLAKPFIVPADAPGEGLRLIFDLEADGLLETVTQVHCLVISELNSGRVHEYPKRIDEALAHLGRADTLIGYNIQAYDLPVLKKLHGWAPAPTVRIIDTLIAARLILPHVDALDGEVAKRAKDKAFGKIYGRYSLQAWGVRLGLGKIGAEIEDWSKWTPAIQARCVGDVDISQQLWRFLQPDGCSRTALDLEHAVAAICDRITADGVPFDRAAAEQLRDAWEARRAALATQLLAQFPTVKNLNSRVQVAALLEARGWQPEKRTKKTNRPVIDDTLLESLPTTYPEFAGLSEYFVLGRRLGQLANGKEAWLAHVDAAGRIHGGLVHIGTPHSRAKHLEPNLAQVPNPKKGAKFAAAECRALFRHSGDWVFVTCDQANLQDRGFAHELAAHDNGAYAQTFAAGVDQHWQTAVALDLMPKEIARDKTDKAHTAIREGAKTFRYAFLFGAGALRAGQIVAQIVRTVGTISPSNDLGMKFWAGVRYPSEIALRQTGRRVLERFVTATPGLRALRAKLTAEHRRHGWVLGLDGRRIPTDADYKALNRIVTSSEAILCKAWLLAAHAELCARFRYGPGGDVYIALWIHDELVACCRPDVAEQVGEILVRHAREAGAHYGFRVPLAAEFKIGRDWAGTPLDDQAEPAAMAAAPPILPEEVCYVDDF